MPNLNFIAFIKLYSHSHHHTITSIFPPPPSTMSFEEEQEAGHMIAVGLREKLAAMCKGKRELDGLVINPVNPLVVCFRVEFPATNIRLSVSCGPYAYDTIPIRPDGTLIYDRFEYEDDVWYHETADDVYREIVRMYSRLSKTGVGAEKTENTEDADGKVES
jgi:hypothetical protein